MKQKKQSNTQKNDEFDEVLRRMLATPPEPHKAKATKPKSKKTKPA